MHTSRRGGGGAPKYREVVIMKDIDIPIRGFRVRKLIPVIVAVISLAILAAPAMAYSGSGAWSWNPLDPNYNGAVTPLPGVYSPLPAPADYIGTALNTYSNGYGDSGAVKGWDDNYVGSVGSADTNGDHWDGLWVQAALPQRGWWDLGDDYEKIVVSTSQDHGPYLAEGLEYHIRGCSQAFADLSCSQSDAVVTAVYLDGWRSTPCTDTNQNDWCSDDITAVLDLGGDYRYVRLEGWGASPLDEPEVDAMGGIRENQGTPVPEFPTLMVSVGFLMGLVLVVTIIRKKEE
jgi:hypothetical protein